MTQRNSALGIIGGSGLYSMKDFSLKKKIALKTPFGTPSDTYFSGELAGRPVVFLPRHGVGHRLNPSEINYRANIWGFKKMGIESIIAVSAVGSLKEEIRPGDMVIVDQFFDRTRNRMSTFFERGIVAHVSFANPVCPLLRGLLIQSTKDSGVRCHEKGTYVCMEGPQFSTKAESSWYRSLGGDVIGMTNLQEAKLAREAGICYATLALSTDYDCWHESEETVTTEMILKVLNQNVQNAQRIIQRVVMDYRPTNCPCRSALKNAILTDRGKITASAKKRLEVLIGKL